MKTLNRRDFGVALAAAVLLPMLLLTPLLTTRRASAAVTCRGLRVSTNPTASAPESVAVATSALVRSPHTFTNMQPTLTDLPVAPAEPAAARGGPRRCFPDER